MFGLSSIAARLLSVLRLAGAARGAAAVLAAATVALLACSASAARPEGASVLPPTSGPYRVGRDVLRLRDASRPEFLTDDPRDVRRLAVLVWYPSSLPPHSRRGEPLEFTSSNLRFARLLQSLGDQRPLSVLLQGLGALAPSSVGGIPVLGGRTRLPIVLLSHGLGNMTEEYASLAEELASYGFVVAGVNHTYASFASMFLPDRPLNRVPELNDAAVGAGPAEGFSAQLNEQWAQDLRFVLTRLHGLNADRCSELYGRLDTTRAAAIGHSFGGSASVLATLTDGRIACAVDIDGSLWARASTLAPSKPVMLLQASDVLTEDLPENPGEEVLAELGLTLEQYRVIRAGAVQASTALRGVSAAGGAWIRLAGATHGQFSDYTLIGQSDGGTIDPVRARTITSTYIRAFLTEKLYGVRSPLLRRASALFPEVTVVRPAP